MRFSASVLSFGMLIQATSTAAYAQGTTPQNVSEAFAYGVTACVKALGNSTSVAALPPLDRQSLRQADATAESMSRPTPGRPMFGVAPANGIVEISEPNAMTCEVIGYGPRVLPTFSAAKASLEAAFPTLRETRLGRTTEDIFAEYEVVMPTGQKVKVYLQGGEPGMGSRRFRFPMFTASVSVAGAPALAPTVAPLVLPQAITPVSVSASFAYGVALCAKSLINGNGIDALPASDRSDVARANPATSEYARALPNDKVYDVLSAKDVVLLNDGGPAQCNVAGFGPRVLPTIAAVRDALKTQAPNLVETPLRRRQGNFISGFTLPQNDGSSINIAVAGREWGAKAPNTPWTAFTAKLTRNPRQ